MKELVKPDDARDSLRAIGALLFGAGVLVLSIRKDDPSGFVNNDGWGHAALLLLYLIPAVVLYGGAIASIRDTGGLRPWQSVASVFGLLFVPFALSEFVNLIDGNPSAALNVFWIAGVTAGLAFYAGLVAGIRFQLLVGSLVGGIAYLALWQKILDDGIFGDFGTLRIILGLFAIVLLAGALYLWRTEEEGLWKASELLTAAGIAAVLATVGVSLTGLVAEAFSDAFSAFGAGGIPGADSSIIWDLIGLAVTVGLIFVGTLIGTRGPVYVGAIGLVLLTAIIGGNFDASPEDRKNGLLWWPAILLLLGAGGIVLSGLKEASLGDKPRKFVEDLRGK